jgi:hypothetical protein
MIPAYKVILFGSFGASAYMMGRLVLVSRVSLLHHLLLIPLQGHKTWFGKN